MLKILYVSIPMLLVRRRCGMLKVLYVPILYGALCPFSPIECLGFTKQIKNAVSVARRSFWNACENEWLR